MDTEANSGRKFVTCEYCQASFTRQSSLNRHRRRTCSGKQRARNITCDKRGKSKRLKNKDKKKDSTCFSTSNIGRPLNQLLSSEETGNNIMDAADVKCINDMCSRLENKNKSVLVIAVDGDSCQWFGSTLGKSFTEENSSLIEEFIMYCKSKNNFPAYSMVKIERECDQTFQSDLDSYDFTKKQTSADDSMVTLKTEITDSDVNDSSVSRCNSTDRNYNANISDDDDDSDSDFIYNSVDDMDDEQSGDDGDKVYTGSKENSAIREKLFQEIAEDFQREEITQSVHYILKKRCTPVKQFVYTVPDLNRGKYQCDVCKYNFLWKVHLDTHKAKVFKCNELKIISSEKEALENTLTFVHSDLQVEITSKLSDLLKCQPNQSLVCVICGDNDFSTRERFSEHLIKHYDEKAFKCNICSSGFPNVKALSSHLREHFRKPYECHKCPWQFSSSFKLDMHVRSVCDNDLAEPTATTIKSEEDIEACVFKCANCTEEITGHAKLRKHMTEMHQCTKGPMECVLCEKKFSFPELYFTHMTIHSIGTHKCPYCSASFRHKSSAYHYHVKGHVEGILSYMCEMCGEKFKYKRYFDIHRRRHTGERPYVCTEEGCSKDFRSLDGLKQHSWVHQNTHFLCNFCGRKFKKPSLLNNHKKTHTEEWRYPCTYCKEKFHTLWRFKQHLARKHPDKVADVKEKFKIILHPCELCPKVYYDREDYRSHMNAHKGIKPFNCPVCGKGFTDKSNMKVHEKIHSGGKRLKCSMCPRRFEDEKFLRSHIDRIHKAEKPIGTQIATDHNYPIPTSCIIWNEEIDEEEDEDELRERTLQIIDETIREEIKF